jgi:hypothetical protein
MPPKALMTSASDRKTLVRKLYQGILHREPSDADADHWASRIEDGLGIDQMVDLFLQSAEFSALRNKVRGLFVPPGHFYSPIVDTEAVSHALPRLRSMTDLPAIAIDPEAMMAEWQAALPFLLEIPFPESPAPGFRYHFDNPAFSYGDGSILYAMLRRYGPQRLVEVGSGYSSACAVDTVERFLDAAVEMTFVEPHPELLQRLLGDESDETRKIIACPVQDADLSVFTGLQAGDFLFIDSTHVLKTGSDVCHELFNILPALNPGVFVHFHDIFWPFEYGPNWVIEQNRSWNEVYALRAFLMYNDAFEIVFFNDYFVRHFRAVVEKDYPALLKNSGGSIWLRKTR